MSEQTAEEGQSSISRVANHHQPSFTVCSSHWHDDTVTEPFQSRHVDLSQQENNRCMWSHPGIICSGSLQSSWYVSTGRHFNASQLCMSDYNRLHPPTTTSNTHWLHLSHITKIAPWNVFLKTIWGIISHAAAESVFILTQQCLVFIVFQEFPEAAPWVARI